MADTAEDHQNASPDADTSHEESSIDPTEQIKEAITSGSTAAVEKILDATPNALDSVFDYTFPGDDNETERLTPLMLAAGLGMLEVTNLLLKRRSDCFAQTERNLNVFALATRRNELEIAKVILQKGGADLIESLDQRYETPLLVAAGNGAINTVDFLIDNGADIKARNGYGDTAIHIAAQKGHFDIVERIYKAGGTEMLELRNRLEFTPLLVAARKGRTEIVRFLLNKGASVMVSNASETTALHLTIRGKSISTAEILLKEDPDLLDLKNAAGDTALHIAVEQGDLEIVEFLLRKGASVMTPGSNENTALHIALKEKKIEIVQLLLKELEKHPGPLELRNKSQETVLLVAAKHGNVQIIGSLLDKGADIKAQDQQKNTILHIALKAEKIEIVQLLLKELEKHSGLLPGLLEIRNEDQETVLLAAAKHGNLQILDFLLHKGADVRAQDEQENTALHIALKEGKDDIALRLLNGLERNSDLLELRNQAKETVLLIAAEKDNLDIVRLLLERNADIEAEDSSGYTALLNAAVSSSYSVVKCLLDAGADRTRTTIRGRNSLHIACYNGNVEVVDLILDSPTNLLKTAIAAKDNYGDTPLNDSVSRDRSSIIFQLLESKVYFPESPAQDEVYIAPESEVGPVSQWLLDWVGKFPTKDANKDANKDEDSQEKTGDGDEPNQDERKQEVSDDKESHQVKHLIAVIYWAILNNREDLIELAMKKGGNPTLTQEGNRKGVTWLHVAALAGYVNLLEKIPDWQNDIMAKATKNITPLHLAVKQGNIDMVKELLGYLESEHPNNQESSRTGWQRVLQAIVQGTEEEENLISLAAARKGGQGHGKVERFLWSKLHELSKNDEKFFELPRSLDAELVMGVAAWRHTTGEKEHFNKFMALAPRGKNCTHLHHDHSPLGLAVCSQFPAALWWLLCSGIYSGENYIREGENIMKNWERPPGTRDPIHELIEELLGNPPPVRPPLKEDGRPPRFQFERPNSDSQKGTVLSLSVTNKREIIFKLKRASMVDIIYDKGPDEIMRNDGYSNFQAFRSELESLKKSTNNQQSEREGPAVGKKPGGVVTKREGENIKKSEKEDASELVSRGRQTRFRWIHIPVNNLRYVEELMIRISMEKNRDNGHHRHLADFVQKTWSELPAGGRNHYMKPNFQFYITEQGTSKSSDTTNPKTSLPIGYNKVLALYMPYIFWGKELNKNDIKDGNERKSISKTDQQETQNGALQRIASSKKKADDRGAKLRPVSTAQSDQETKEPDVYLHPFNPSIHETGSSAALTSKTNETVEQEHRVAWKQNNDNDDELPTNDIHVLTKKPVHKSVTLDQYYYVSLQDTRERDRDQVLVRYYKRLREHDAKSVNEKKQRAKKEERPRRGQKATESSLQTHDHQHVTQGGDSPTPETVANVKPTQILMINQLWLWILDSDTIITSTTEESDEITNTFLQRVLINLQARNGNTISSIEDIAEYIIATATSLFNAQDIEIDHSEDGKRSPLDIFRETIQHVRDEETKLFREFRISLDAAKQDKSSSKDNNTSVTYSEADVQKQEDLQTTKKPQKWWRQLAPENPYEDISMETQLLDEVKDILDELNILKTLAQDQKVVDDLWKSFSKIPGNRHLSPLETKEDIESMIEDAKSVQSAINTLLDLKQKEATILEAQATRRQSDAVMVFTVVTIIFLPASFLTSMFALNVSDFPHQDDNLIYQGAWIFPIIFGVSVPVSIIFMIIAFNANKIKSMWKAGTEAYKNQMFQTRESKKQTGDGTVRRRIMGPGNDGNV